ncbi:hypothetical protein AVEN_41758-1 [Araneus ventricosus]|uniref:Uncharacterized protein n=1 Tax=Araneus ventricosus TaxID=182803 RepID=A0A4Y2ABR7_ARAVE|nr:hypothetical protein AVEN_41758-1 [Araneus ventricosus]
MVFLDILTSNSELISVKFRLFAFILLLDPTNCSEDTLGAIHNSLNSQHQLKRVEYYRCFYLFQDIELIRVITSDFGEFSSHLVLRKFVEPIEPRKFNCCAKLTCPHNPKNSLG